MRAHHAIFAFFLTCASALQPRFTSNQRGLLVPATTETQPPLVVLVGMAQTLSTWQLLHGTALSKQRHVLFYQALGLGEAFEACDVSLPAQADCLLQTLNEAFPDEKLVDVAGFSLGGRIALAAAVIQPDRFRRLHLTGVARQRSDWGHLTLWQWQDHLQQDNLRAFAWSALLASYSPAFLKRQSQERLQEWIAAVTKSQTSEGLSALLEQAHPEQGEWSVSGTASQVLKKKGRLVVGEGDQLAPVEYVQALAEDLGWGDPMVIPTVGHSVPIESPRLWREDLLLYLDGEDE